VVGNALLLPTLPLIRELINDSGHQELAANQARLSAGCLACNLLHMIRDAAFWGESVKPSIDSVIRRLVKVGARVVCHASLSVGYFHLASAFSNLNAQ